MKIKLGFKSIAAIFSLLGAAILTYMTVWGPGFIDWDSFSYISVARNLASGQGLVYPLSTGSIAPLSEFPPGYSIFLSLFSWFGMDAIPAARLLNIIVFSSLLFFSGLTVKETTNSTFAALAIIFLLVTFSPLLISNSFVLSEGLFLFLTVFSFYLFARIHPQKSWLYLALAGIILSLLPLTRYVGLANIAASLLFLFFFADVTVRKRVLKTTFVAAISLLPFVLWLLYILNNALEAGSRRFRYIPVDQDDLLRFFYTVTTWFLPENLVVGNEKTLVVLFTLISLTVISLLVVSRKPLLELILRQETHRARAYLFLYASYLVIFLLVVIAVRFFMQPINLVDRILLPAYISILILFGFVLGFAWQSNIRVLRVVSLLVPALLLLYYGTTAYETITKAHDQGQGLARKSIQNSAPLQKLEQLSADNFTIYTNYPWALYLRIGNTGIPINQFDPDNPSHLGDDVFIALFTFEKIDGTAIANKYKDIFELVMQDNIVSIYKLSAQSAAP